MNSRQQDRFIRRLLGMHLKVQYRIARDRIILGIVGVIIALNIFNYFVTNPLNVDRSIKNSSPLKGLIR